MPTLKIKSTHKPIKAYYESLEQFERIGVTNETSVRSAFQALLEWCGRQVNWTLVPEYAIACGRNKRIVVDGALIDDFNLLHGVWEAKDMDDDLQAEVQRKFAAGYPSDNILFQTPARAILWQRGEPVLDEDVTDPQRLIETLTAFFSHRPQEIAEWEEAVAQFKGKVPAIGRGLAAKIQRERQSNRGFATAFADFLAKCRSSINPNLSDAAVEEMLIQHLLTERIFRTVFSNPDFTRRNVIAVELEKVIDALTSRSFNRAGFLQSLDRFYAAIEHTGGTIGDFAQKQHFLNAVYEQFFQGFSVEIADTHGIVYTPQSIVDFMVRSVEHILKAEFGRSLSDAGVHIIDPFVGTGNFIAHTMRAIRKTSLEGKYASELHCNEVMLLPYYIASMNIEHEFYEAMGYYQPFAGICLVDTFELAEEVQMALFTAENTVRVERQKETPMFVIIGNPPYNVGQVNEHDNNKNRQYETMDARVSATYAKDSKATLKRQLQDPYTKAIRWAADRIGAEGIVAFVTNNGFLDGIAFDGMRKHLADDFNAIYVLDLGGNVRKNPKLSGTTHNVFGIQIGVSINLFVKRSDRTETAAKIFYSGVDKDWRKEEKYRYLDEKGHCGNVEWKEIVPDERHTWLTEGLQNREFAAFLPLGSKEAKAGKSKEAVIFQTYSSGVNTGRDAWVYGFNRGALAAKIQRMIGAYNAEVDRWGRTDEKAKIDDFVEYDDAKIKWSSTLKNKLKSGKIAEFAPKKMRCSLYRPFTKSKLYFDRMMNDRVGVFPSIFPTPETEAENQVIIVPGAGGRTAYWCFCTDMIPCLALTSLDSSQCFPFYTYDEDGTNRRENITDTALARFRLNYRDDAIGKWDMFHYVYGLLHHPQYRARYQANLKRALPHIPYEPNFWAYAKAGKRLAEIHVGYEEVPEYQLEFSENPDLPLDWRVAKMRLSRDKTQIRYNDFLTLVGIPPAAFDYRLGNRSALEWVIDQYAVKTDKRSGIVNDPNRSDDPQYIAKLLGKVIAVSVETVEIVKELPKLEAANIFTKRKEGYEVFRELAGAYESNRTDGSLNHDEIIYGLDSKP